MTAIRFAACEMQAADFFIKTETADKTEKYGKNHVSAHS